MTISIFDEVKIRNQWFDSEGLARAWTESPKTITRRPKRNAPWIASMIVAVAFSAASSVTLAAPPGQVVMTWPTPATAQSAKDNLRFSLRTIKKLGKDWSGNPGSAPVRESIDAAERLLPQLPNIALDARAGVDGDGNVYLRLSKGTRVAYLTVEASLLHLFYTDAGNDNVYIDDQKFKGSVLPSRIVQVLSEKLT